MIIKCISYKSKNFSNIVRYVMAGHKLDPSVKPTKEKPLYVPGIKFSKQDLKFLAMERDDAQLMQELKEQGGDMQKFIKDLMAQAAQRSQANEQGKENGQASLQPIIFRHNLRSRSSIEGFIKEFSDNEKLRLHSRSNNVTAHHNILSFSKADSQHFSEDIIKDIAQKYISIRGPDSVFLGAVHQDKEHLHIHLIQSGVQYCTGMANRVSRQQFQEMKVAMQEYLQKYPQLVNQPDFKTKHTNMEHGKNVKNANDRTSERGVFIKLLETTFAKSNSTEHFLDQLQEMGHEPYYRNGRLQGIKLEGDKKFRLASTGLDKKLEELDMVKAVEEVELKELLDLRNHTRDRSKETTKQAQKLEEELDNYAIQQREECKIIEENAKMAERDIAEGLGGNYSDDHGADERADERELDEDVDIEWETEDLEDDISFEQEYDNDLER